MGSSLVKPPQRESSGRRARSSAEQNSRSHGRGNGGTNDGQKDEWYKVDPLAGPISNYCKPVTVISSQVGKPVSNKKPDHKGTPEYVSSALKNDYSSTSTVLPQVQTKSLGQGRSSATGRGDSSVPGLPPIVQGQQKTQSRRSKIFSGSCVGRRSDKLTEAEKAANETSDKQVKQQTTPATTEAGPSGKSAKVDIDDQDVSRDARTPSPEYDDFAKVVLNKSKPFKTRKSASSPVDFYKHSENLQPIKEISPGEASIKESATTVMKEKLDFGEDVTLYSYSKASRCQAYGDSIVTMTTKALTPMAEIDGSVKSEIKNDWECSQADMKNPKTGSAQKIEPVDVDDDNQVKTLQQDCDDESTLHFSESVWAHGDVHTGVTTGNSELNSVHLKDDSKVSLCADDKTIEKHDKLVSDILHKEFELHGSDKKSTGLEKSIGDAMGDSKIEKPIFGSTPEQQVYLCTAINYDKLSPVNAKGQPDCVSYSSDTKCFSEPSQFEFENADEPVKPEVSTIQRIDTSKIQEAEREGGKTTTTSKPCCENEGSLRTGLAEIDEGNLEETKQEAELDPIDLKPVRRVNKSEADMEQQARLNAWCRDSSIGGQGKADKEKRALTDHRPASWSHISAEQTAGQPLTDRLSCSEATGDNTLNDGATGGAFASVILSARDASPQEQPESRDSAVDARSSHSKVATGQSTQGSGVDSRPRQKLSRTSMGAQETPSHTHCNEDLERPASARSHVSGQSLSSCRQQGSRPSSAQSSHRSRVEPGADPSGHSIAQLSAQGSRHKLSRSLSNHSSGHGSMRSPRPPSTGHSPRPPSTSCSGEGGPRKIRSRPSLVQLSASKTSHKEPSAHSLNAEPQKPPSSHKLNPLVPSGSSIKTYELPNKLTPIDLSASNTKYGELPDKLTSTGLSESNTKTSELSEKLTTAKTPLSGALPLEIPMKLPPIRTSSGLLSQPRAGLEPWTTPVQQARLPPVGSSFNGTSDATAESSPDASRLMHNDWRGSKLLSTLDFGKTLGGAVLGNKGPELENLPKPTSGAENEENEAQPVEIGSSGIINVEPCVPPSLDADPARHEELTDKKPSPTASQTSAGGLAKENNDIVGLSRKGSSIREARENDSFIGLSRKGSSIREGSPSLVDSLRARLWGSPTHTEKCADDKTASENCQEASGETKFDCSKYTSRYSDFKIDENNTDINAIMSKYRSNLSGECDKDGSTDHTEELDEPSGGKSTEEKLNATPFSSDVHEAKTDADKDSDHFTKVSDSWKPKSPSLPECNSLLFKPIQKDLTENETPATEKDEEKTSVNIPDSTTTDWKSGMSTTFDYKSLLAKYTSVRKEEDGSGNEKDVATNELTSDVVSESDKYTTEQKDASDVLTNFSSMNKEDNKSKVDALNSENSPEILSEKDHSFTKVTYYSSHLTEYSLENKEDTEKQPETRTDMPEILNKKDEAMIETQDSEAKETNPESQGESCKDSLSFSLATTDYKTNMEKPESLQEDKPEEKSYSSLSESLTSSQNRYSVSSGLADLMAKYSSKNTPTLSKEGSHEKVVDNASQPDITLKTTGFDTASLMAKYASGLTYRGTVDGTELTMKEEEYGTGDKTLCGNDILCSGLNKDSSSVLDSIKGSYNYGLSPNPPIVPTYNFSTSLTGSACIENPCDNCTTIATEVEGTQGVETKEWGYDKNSDVILPSKQTKTNTDIDTFSSRLMASMKTEISDDNVISQVNNDDDAASPGYVSAPAEQTPALADGVVDKVELGETATSITSLEPQHSDEEIITAKETLLPEADGQKGMIKDEEKPACGETKDAYPKDDFKSNDFVSNDISNLLDEVTDTVVEKLNETEDNENVSSKQALSAAEGKPEAPYSHQGVLEQAVVDYENAPEPGLTFMQNLSKPEERNEDAGESFQDECVSSGDAQSETVETKVYNFELHKEPAQLDQEHCSTKEAHDTPAAGETETHASSQEQLQQQFVSEEVQPGIQPQIEPDQTDASPSESREEPVASNIEREEDPEANNVKSQEEHEEFTFEQQQEDPEAANIEPENQAATVDTEPQSAEDPISADATCPAATETNAEETQDDQDPGLPETLPTEVIHTIKTQIYEEGLKPCQRDGGVAFFIPVSNTGLQPPTSNPDLKDRLAKTKKQSLSYEERMLMADINRHNQLSKKKEFAVKDLINVKAATANASSASPSGESINTQADRPDKSESGSSF